MINIITVVVRWESGWFGFEQGLMTEYSYWEQVFMSYKIDRVIFVPKLMKSTLEQYDTLDEALATVSGTKVFLENDRRAREIGRDAVYLRDFKHPVDAVYIFGTSAVDNSGWIEDEDILLSLKTSGKGDMFALTMAGIVFNDREMKEHGN